MSMRDRMNRLRGNGAQTNEQPLAIAETETVDSVETEGVLHPAWSSFGVKLRQGEKGEYLVRISQFDLSHHHGTHALGELREAAAGLSEFHVGIEAIEPEQILYLDLETTGLGVGTGNVPFMVGLSYLQGDRFVVEQTLIRHPAEEYAMLYDLGQRLRNYRYLATYNGKTFDWPLVYNRMIMNGLGRPLKQPLHLDFLHPSRSIWRNTLVSCKLSHIEEERLGIVRSDDVPGSLAPQLYFQFLADGDPTPLEGVFIHNELDLLSLACLSIRFGHLLKEDIFKRIPHPVETEELVRTGLWLERMGKDRLIEELYHRAVVHESPTPSSLAKLAARDKKAGNWERAVLLWQKVVHVTEFTQSPSGQDACIELSMYYEHKIKDWNRSLFYASEALVRCQHLFEGKRLDAKATTFVENIRKRIQRLQLKINKRESGVMGK
ncbi:ribonuclease H-like domain-containing protein [Paenibacillus sp. strain BS8-2]